MRIRCIVAIHLGAGLLGAFVACGDDDDDAEHCADLDGDATCAQWHPDGDRPRCVQGWCDLSARDGCVATLPDDPDCPAPCGTSADTDASCGGTTVGTTVGPTTTSPTEPGTTSPVDTSTDAGETADPDSTSTGTDTDTAGCIDDRECGDTAPFCLDGACVPCSQTRDPDGSCAGVDPDRPLCIDDACAQCSERDTTVCTGTVPICDVDAHTCVGCTHHEQCPDSACHLADGSCLPIDRVFHVDGDALDCAAPDGSAALPFCAIADALAEIGPAGRATLRIAATTLPYLEPLAVTGDRVVALVPWGDDPPVLDRTGTGSTLTVDGATIYAWRVRFEGSGSAPAIAMVDSRGWIDRTVVVLNDGGGIRIEQGSELHLVNTVIGANGTGLAARVGLDADASTFDVVFGTIAGNDGTGAASLRCTAGANGSLRNSLVVGLDPPSIDCAGLDAITSAVDTNGLGGADVLVVPSFVAGWFVDPPTGDFHLVPDTQFETLGVWASGDPLVDLDGDPRPTMDGAIEVLGADRP